MTARPPGPAALAAYRALVATRVTDADFLTRTAVRYPRIAHVRLGPEHLYLLSHPDLVRLLLVESGRRTAKSRGLQAARRLLGAGLLTSEDPLHRIQRRLIQPAFHHDRIAGYAGQMVAAAARTAESWRPGCRVDMGAQMSTVTFDAVGRALVGTDLRGRAGAVQAALRDLLAAYNRAFLPGFDLALRLGTPLGRRVTAARDRLDAVVARTIAEHRAAGDRGDLLSALIAAGMPDQQLRDEIMTLLLAGHETTASTLTFGWYLLAGDPEVATWLHEELDAVLGDRPPGYADLDRLPRTRAVVAETMRLYPPAWAVSRRLSADLPVDGWVLPAGSTALVSQWVLHRDPRFWPRPLRFEPTRWLAGGGFDPQAPGAPRHAYFPFGAGGRICVGEAFAWTEAVLVLARLARHWAPRVADGYRLRLRPAITLRPDGPLPMDLIPR